MELPNLLNFRKQEQTAKYLAVEIGPEFVRSVVWEIVDQTTNIIQIGTTEQVDPSDPEKLLIGLDASLAQALVGIEPEPNEVILSLPDGWLSQSEITPDKKQLLKYVTSKLELKPIGFVVTLEAVVHFLELKRGQPLNSILLGITSEEVAVSVVQNGRILATHNVGRSDDLGSDVEEGLARFGDITNLPAHFVLYDGVTDIETLQQDLLDYDWQTRLAFLHIPKIDRLTNRQVIEAIVETGGSEVIKLTPESQVGSTQSGPESQMPTSPQEESEPDPEIPDKQEQFGFVVSHPDIQVDETGLDEVYQPTEADANVVEAELIEPEQENDDSDQENISSGAVPPKPGLLGRMKRKKTTRIPTRGRSKRVIIMAILFISLSLGGISAAVAAYWYLPQATVTLYVKPRTINRQTEFTIDTTITNVDLATNSIPGVPIETEITAEAETPATGERLIGETAKGTVTLYNRTDSVKAFEAGTRITGPGNLVYTINEAVTIASASSKENQDLSVTIEPATTSVGITASAIGAEYNMAEGTELSVANFDKSSYVARASSPIAGGTSREITAVAQADIDMVREAVRQEIESKVLAQVNQSQQGFTGAVILSDGDGTAEEELSAELGEEASSVKLSAGVLVRSMTYKKSDLALIVQNQVREEIPANYNLDQDDLNLEVQTTDEIDQAGVEVAGKVELTVSPNLDVLAITQAIRGKFPAVTEDYFKSLPGFERVEIDIQPDMPTSIKTFPRFADRIEIIIQPV